MLKNDEVEWFSYIAVSSLNQNPGTDLCGESDCMQGIADWNTLENYGASSVRSLNATLPVYFE